MSKIILKLTEVSSNEKKEIEKIVSNLKDEEIFSNKRILIIPLLRDSNDRKERLEFAEKGYIVITTMFNFNSKNYSFEDRLKDLKVDVKKFLNLLELKE